MDLIGTVRATLRDTVARFASGHETSPGSTSGSRTGTTYLETCLLALLVLTGLSLAPTTTTAQERPGVSFSITVSDDVGGVQELGLGLAPMATAGNDNMFGEGREPPFPPNPSSLVARLVDEDLNDGNGLNEFPDSGMLVDVRQGSADFSGTKAHEIRFDTGEDASEITFSWTLPDGVTGTLQDQTALGRGNELDVDMSGSGSATLSNLAVEKALVTLDYSGNQPPTNIQSKRITGDGPVDFARTGASLAFSGASGTGDVTVTKIANDPSGTEGIAEENVSNSRLTINAGSSLSFEESTVRLAVRSFEGIDDPSNITIYKRPSAGSGTFSALETTIDDNGTPSDVSDDTLSATTGSFSEFVLASNSEPLPVEMAGFEGTTTESGVRLTWQTASEENNAEFEVQRKADDGPEATWTKIGFVDSKAAGGTTSEAQSYRFTDENLPYAADRLKYRLRQVDLDGTESFTEPVVIERRPAKLELRGAFPNPARDRVTVRYAVPKRQDVRIELYDVLGRQVRTIRQGKAQGREEIQVDLSGLTSGSYFLRLTAGSKTETQRLTIVR